MSGRTLENVEKVKKDGNFCGMSKRSYEEVKAHIAFIEEHGEISPLTEEAVKPLIREQDTEVRDEAIKKISEDVIGKQHAGRGHKKKITAEDVKIVIDKERGIRERKRELEDGMQLDSSHNALLSYLDLYNIALKAYC